MRSTQDKVMAALQDAANDYSLDFVIDPFYGNNGRVRFETKDINAEPVLSFEYAFQQTYWKLDEIRPTLAGLREPDEGKRQHVAVWPPTYDIGEKPDAVLKAIRDHLARWYQAELEKTI